MGLKVAQRLCDAGHTVIGVGLAHRLSAVTLRVIFGREEEGLSAHRPKPAGAIVDASLSEVLERLTAGR